MRRKANLSQKEFAHILGVSERAVQEWEYGAVPQPRHRRLLVEFAENFAHGQAARAKYEADIA